MHFVFGLHSLLVGPQKYTFMGINKREGENSYPYRGDFLHDVGNAHEFV
jgi:hypothetical protein